MAKTGKQIQGDIYRLLRDSQLYTNISGEVYRNGYRPRDSKKEDIVVTFTAGLPDEIQTGVVTVNVYVPDVDPYKDGTWIEDGERTENMERLARAWVESLTADVSCYRFKLQQTIYTESEEEIHQHFVVVKLKYSYYGGDYSWMKIHRETFLDASNTTSDAPVILVTEEGEPIVVNPVIRIHKLSTTD